GERLAHLAEDVHAAVLGLAERDPHDLLVDAGDLDVHLQRGDAALGPVPTNVRFLHDGRSPDRPALHYVLFALPTFTPRRVTGAISLTLQARWVPCSAHPSPSWPKPFVRACWRARWRPPWSAAAPAAP